MWTRARWCGRARGSSGRGGGPLSISSQGRGDSRLWPIHSQGETSQPFFAAKDSNSSDIPHPSLISVSIWGRPPSLLTLPPQPPWGVVRAGTLCCCFDGKETKAKQTVGPRSQGSSARPSFCFNWGLWWKEHTLLSETPRPDSCLRHFLAGLGGPPGAPQLTSLSWGWGTGQ